MLNVFFCLTPAGTEHGTQLCVAEAGVVKAAAGGQMPQYGNHYFKVSFGSWMRVVIGPCEHCRPCGHESSALKLGRHEGYRYR